MKINYLLAISLLLTPGLLAQTNGTNNAPTFPPPTALGQESLNKIRGMTPLFDGKTFDGWKLSKKGTNDLGSKSLITTVANGGEAENCLVASSIMVESAYPELEALK